MTASKEQITSLQLTVEEAIGRQPQTPKDFDTLSDRIFARTGEMVSRNTLRRIWGRIGGDVMPRHSTLDILARFVGYNDYKAFCGGIPGGESSSPFLGRHLSVADGLMPGDRLRLTWQPGRVCDVQYNGSLHFRVTHAENTRLREGDTFLCSIIVEGQPLYLDQLQHAGQTPITYICGKLEGGVRFELL